MPKNLEDMTSEGWAAYTLERLAPPTVRVLRPGESMSFMIVLDSPRSTSGPRAARAPERGRAPAPPAAGEGGGGPASAR